MIPSAEAVWWERFDRAMHPPDDPHRDIGDPTIRSLAHEWLCALAGQPTSLVGYIDGVYQWRPTRPVDEVVDALGEYLGIGRPPASVLAGMEARREQHTRD